MIAHQLVIAGPAWTDKVTAFATAVAAIGFVVAAVGSWFAFDQLKETRRDRHIQILSEYGRRWDDEHLTEARELQSKFNNLEMAEKVEKWAKAPHEDHEVRILLRVPNYFEDLAIMVELGRLKLKYVILSSGDLILREWEYWNLAVAKMRSSEAGEESYTEFEKLASDIRAAAN